MKKILINILFLFILSISSTTFAFPNEPNRFRDFYWGESLQEVKNSCSDITYVSYNSQNNSVKYVAHLNNPYISGHKFDLVGLDFWNNQLICISIYFNVVNHQEVSYTDLISSLETRFGKSFYVSNGTTMWIGDIGSIGVNRDLKSNMITLLIANLDLMYKAEQDAASKGW